LDLREFKRLSVPYLNTTHILGPEYNLFESNLVFVGKISPIYMLPVLINTKEKWGDWNTSTAGRDPKDERVFGNKD